MFLVREAETRDLEDLYRLAGMANFINLPHDRSLLTKQITKSVNSFRNKTPDPRQAEYMFVLEDLSAGRVIGSSMMLAQHGTPDEPHTYFQVVTKKKVSKSLHIGFLHQVLRLGFDFDGPTEIGGLVLNPEYRSRPEKLGRMLSFSRFLYMAARRPRFRDEVLCELMPPFNERGESPIWEEVGRKFTNLRYDEADRLSRRSKEFITSLFPEGDIYTCMLASEARQAIGQVNADTMPVKKMLESIGFQYRNMIDPFDGGPHYWAKTSSIDPVKRTKRMRYMGPKQPKESKTASGLLLVFAKKGVRVTYAKILLKSGTEFTVEPRTAEALGLEAAAEVHFLELKS
ncbi:MAG: arginine N-succinyltransferase [Bdellovibrionales bacterium]|nr:arginine N-succinyltransferase [Bdellovibrionales bacterium]